ncbi:MAG: EAL domain-containing protein [Acidiferrobacterales bacterium]
MKFFVDTLGHTLWRRIAAMAHKIGTNLACAGSAAGRCMGAAGLAYSPMADVSRSALVFFALSMFAGYVYYLVRRLRTSEIRLSSLKAGWNEALDFTEDALYLVDLDDNLIRGNRAFYQYINREPSQAIGRDIMVLVHGKRDEEPCPVCQARQDRRDTVVIKEADDPVNRLKRPIEIIVRVIRNDHGSPVGILHVIRDLSRHRHGQEAMRSSEERFRRLSEAAFEGIFIHDRGTILDANQTLASMFGCGLDELLGANVLELVHETSHDFVRKSLVHPIDEPFEVEAVRKDRSRFSAEVRGRHMSHGERTLRVVAVRDVSELRRAQLELFEEKERLLVTLESIGEAVITTDINGRIRYINPVAEKLTGWTNAQAYDHALVDVFRIASELTGEYLPDPVRRCLAEDRLITSEEESILHHRENNESAIEHSIAPIRGRDGAVTGTVIVFRDVTQIRRMARQLNYQASHDTLTGLVNRREFEMRLNQAIGTTASEGSVHSLCYLDLDQFKLVNDTCGHIAGDQLLKQVAALLKSRLRGSDVLARLGGDEFGVLLEGCRLDKAREIAEAMRHAVNDMRFVWHSNTFNVSASIGLVPVTAESGGLIEVLSTADAACYVAKDSGRNRVHVWQPDDAALARHHSEMEWAQRVTRAVEGGRLLLYGQLIAPLAGAATRVARYEVLVRMLDESGNAVLPSAFIPAAERYNVMQGVDRWVIRAMLSAAALNPETPDGDMLQLSVNVSGRSLCDEQFLDFVMREIIESGIAPERLCFEITETAAIANLILAQRFVSMLKGIGCAFALDDFGSGLSSFSYLKNLQVDYLKIDSSFVRDIAHDPIDYAMVESINQLGHVMGIKTVAEYAEDELILEKLRKIGVDYAQGFAIAAPVPLVELLTVRRRCATP